MSGDYSRQRFALRKDYSGVFMQQGRVQLDADWNELVEIVARRLHAETIDTIGPATVPKQTPDGFKIAFPGPTIGRGRIYVDGLLAENHGKTPLEFDPGLAEERGTAPLPYDEQPYRRNVAADPFPTTGGPHLVYLDVWEREITDLEDPALMEIAVGVDTTTRSQTAWQVRVLPNVGAGANCATPDAQLTGWLALTSPSAGRLTTAAVAPPADENLCLSSPQGGYTGLENRLYRVEIHDVDAQGAATFKWSRDNASLATRVTAMPQLNTLVVDRVGRDALLRFQPGDWIEITDDWRELTGQPGIMARIKTDGVNDTTRTITLDDNLPAGVFPTNAQGATDPGRHTRIRRWDQRGEIRDAAGTLLVDLSATPPPAAGKGVIPVPTNGVAVVLEDGVQITFSLAPGGGRFHSGDYWTFAARTADASVEPLAAAPPRGVHHHYCRLAIVTPPSNVTDCRTLWPPDVAVGGCDCTACVDADSHNSGVYTIQRAIDDAKSEGGKVCLAPGEYILQEPLRIESARSLLLQGKGWMTNLIYMGDGPALVVEKSSEVTIEALRLMTSQIASVPATVFIHDSVAITVQRCTLIQIPRRQDDDGDERDGTVIGLSGLIAATFIRENIIVGGVGVQNPPWDAVNRERLEGEGGLLATGLYIEDNALRCQRRGISLESVLFTAETRIAGNLIDGCEDAGIVTTGQMGGERAIANWAGGAHLEIRGNTLGTTGDGIRTGVMDTRILDNDIGDDTREDRRGNNGIMLVETGFNQNSERCQILGNRIRGLNGHGIAIEAFVRSLMIKQNIIERVAGNGIHMAEASGDLISIENNAIADVARQATDRGSIVAGIHLNSAGEVAIGGNTIVGVGLETVESQGRAGILLAGITSARITNNEVAAIGPEQFLGSGAGIAVLGFSESIDVLDNIVHRGRNASDDLPGAEGDWYALWIGDARRSRDDVQVTATRTLAPILNARFVPRLDPRLIALLVGRHALELVSGKSSVGVRGNVFDTYGETVSVGIAIDGPCVFSENRCGSRARNGDAVVIVTIRARAVVASGNIISGVEDATGLEFWTGQRNERDEATVLGNIARPTFIHLNGSSLRPPWVDLNR